MFSSRIDRIEPRSLFNKPQWVIKKSAWIVVNCSSSYSVIDPSVFSINKIFFKSPFVLRDFYFVKVKILFMKEFVSSSVRQWKKFTIRALIVKKITRIFHKYFAII